MKCVNCKSENRGSECVEVMHQGVEIGFVCSTCLMGVNALRLFVKKQKDGTMELKEYQPIPNPR